MLVKVISERNKEGLEKVLSDLVNDNNKIVDIKFAMNNSYYGYNALVLYDRDLYDKSCLHCGENEGKYCEDCYQQLISENAKLQLSAKDVNINKEGLKNNINDYLDILENKLHSFIIHKSISEEVFDDLFDSVKSMRTHLEYTL